MANHMHLLLSEPARAALDEARAIKQAKSKTLGRAAQPSCTWFLLDGESRGEETVIPSIDTQGGLPLRVLASVGLTSPMPIGLKRHCGQRHPPRSHLMLLSPSSVSGDGAARDLVVKVLAKVRAQFVSLLCAVAAAGSALLHFHGIGATRRDASRERRPRIVSRVVFSRNFFAQLPRVTNLDRYF